MTEKLALVGFFVVVGVAYNVMYLGAAAATARVFRVAVQSFVLGWGPVLLRRGAFRLHAVPLSAYFEPAYRESLTPVDPASEMGKALERRELRWFDDLSWPAAALLMSLSVWVAVLVAVVGLGVGPAVEATLGAVRSYLVGAVGPLSEAPRLLDAALSYCRAASVLEALGAAFAVLAGVNLLLLPGNVLFVAAIKAKRRGPLYAKAVLMILPLVLGVAWLVGLVVWMARA